MQTLSHAISKETHETARDNVIGAIARLIITNYSSLPLEQILPVFVQQLPLKIDWDEHKAVFQSIHTLYQAGVNVLQSYISRLLRIAITILHEEKYNDEGKFVTNIKCLLYTCKYCQIFYNLFSFDSYYIIHLTLLFL